MSVFIRKETKDGTYSYDFQHRGRRFSGSTGETSKRAAKQVEAAKLAEAKASYDADRSLYADELTIQNATARYWQEVGQHHANANTTLWSLGWIVDHFGAGTPLHEIDDAKVATMVAKRRGEFVPVRRKKPARDGHIPPKRIQPATVNRTVTQPLREVHLRARGTWKVRTAEIDWGMHLLPEPQERVREANVSEEAAIMEQLERGYDSAVKFAFLSGCRRMEIIGLIWSRVDFFGRQFTVIGKGNKSRVIPMSQAIFDLLWVQQNFHPDVVFTFEAKRDVRMPNGKVLMNGMRYPLTESGLKTAMRRAVPRSGVTNFHFHDTRHTAATRVLRASNLKVAQKLLGHQDIKTTTKYAHAMNEDIRNALEAASQPTVIHSLSRPAKNTS